VPRHLGTSYFSDARQFHEGLLFSTSQFELWCLAGVAPLALSGYAWRFKWLRICSPLWFWPWVGSCLFCLFFLVVWIYRPTVFPEKVLIWPWMLGAFALVPVLSSQLAGRKAAPAVAFVLALAFAEISFRPLHRMEPASYEAGKYFRKIIPELERETFLIEKSGWGWLILHSFLTPARIFYDRPNPRSGDFERLPSAFRQHPAPEFRHDLLHEGVTWVIVRSADIVGSIEKNWRVQPDYMSGDLRAYRLQK